MTESKFLGILPCMAHDNCPCYKKCGGDWDWKQPNLKKLHCILRHIDTLAYELYKRDEPHHKCEMSEYAFELAWTMHNEIAQSAKLAVQWNEPRTDTATFYAVENAFLLFVERNDCSFLLETKMLLQKVAHELDTVG